MSAKLLALILVGVFVGVSGYTFHYAKGTSYLSADPKACANCHVMRSYYDSWQKSSHASQGSCVSCHIPQKGLSKWSAKMANGLKHSWAFTFQNFPDPIRISSKNAKILTANCANCHNATVSSMLSSSVHQKTQFNCLVCHAQVGHGAAR